MSGSSLSRHFVAFATPRGNKTKMGRCTLAYAYNAGFTLFVWRCSRTVSMASIVLIVAVWAQGLDGPRLFRRGSRVSRSIGIFAMLPTSVTLGPSNILAFGEDYELTRPCVDCGLYTGRFCDWCLGSERIPSQSWCEGQRTPLCSRCDNRWDACHFCRGLHWCTPPAWGPASAEVRAAETARHQRPRN